MSKKKTLLIDGDLILYRGCVACERDVRYPDGNHVLTAHEDEAWKNVTNDVERLFKRFDTKEHVIALSEGPIFRLAISPDYKSNRAGQRKPLCFYDVMAMMEREYRVVKLKGLEADDVLGIFGSRDPDGSIICSDDKDMLSVPATVYRLGEVKRISREDADYWHLYQTLIGDTTDGYPGCPGIGPKKAEAILGERTCPNCVPKAECPECSQVNLWHRVVEAFRASKGNFEDPEAEALKQARLARILRDEDWDSVKKEPILWTP